VRRVRLQVRRVRLQVRRVRLQVRRVRLQVRRVRLQVKPVIAGAPNPSLGYWLSVNHGDIVTASVPVQCNPELPPGY
jgi:hypothetical protein